YGYAPAAAYYAAPAELSSQYHSQDNLGQYSYGYNGGLSAKTETKSFDGVTRGSYSYLDAENKLQTVTYTADAPNGFRAQATNLPQAPIETRVAPEPLRDATAAAPIALTLQKEPLAIASYAAPAQIAAFAPSQLSYATYSETAPAFALNSYSLPASYAWNHAPAYAYSY
ncbi:AAEL013031-PA, partial [Aedes aegypti]